MSVVPSSGTQYISFFLSNSLYNKYLLTLTGSVVPPMSSATLGVKLASGDADLQSVLLVAEVTALEKGQLAIMNLGRTIVNVKVLLRKI